MLNEQTQTLFEKYNKKYRSRRKRNTTLILFFIIIFLIVGILCYINFIVNPIILSIGEAKVKSLATKAVNSAVSEVLFDNYTYDDDSSISPGDKPSGDDSDATNQDIVDGLGDLNSSIGDLNDSINSSDVNSDDYENFFSDFEDNNHGLLSFITAPLSFIQSLTNSTCTPITVPIPFVDSSVTLPCMTTIYQRYFGSFFTVYQMITNGIIAYWIGINCYRIVKNMKNPNSYYVEVMGL